MHVSFCWATRSPPQVSTMLPEVFLERRIRVFCTREDQDDKYVRPPRVSLSLRAPRGRRCSCCTE